MTDEFYTYSIFWRRVKNFHLFSFDSENNTLYKNKPSGKLNELLYP